MAQITEDYVSFETAKLLKEKGFDAKCNRYYNAQYEVARTVSDTFAMNFNDETLVRGLMMEGAYSIPTQQMAMRWLREVHNLNVEPYATAPGFRFQINKAGNIKDGDISGGTSVYDSNFDGPNDGGAWDSYEDAVEAAIKYCLTNLI